MTPLAQKIEALLFLAGEAVALEEMPRVLECSGEDVLAALAEIRQELHDGGLTLIQTETHVQLTTSPRVGSFVANFVQTEAQSLSAAAAETLSIIAYRGPLERSEIDLIRGVDSRRMVRQLLARGLVRKTDDTKLRARYIITEEFLQFMGLQKREELPRFAELSDPEKIQALLKKEE
jgi:segregation and condensation protein B